MIDRHSATWAAMRRLIDTRIEKLRSDLETPGVDPAGLRGEIASLRWIIAQAEPTPPPEHATSVDYLQVR